MTTIDQPGSPDAVAQGCTCPPQMGQDDMIVDVNCPLHANADNIEPDLSEPVDPKSG